MIKNTLVVVLVVLGIVVVGWLLWNKSQDTAPTPAPTPTATPSESVIKSTPMNTTINGLQIKDIEVGTGAEAKSGDTVAVHYVGTLTNGQKFDSSIDRGQPFIFSLGAGEVIRGWDLGVAGMKVGGKRQLVIPAELAYGSRAVGDKIPANSTLVFEVQLLEIGSN